MDLLYFLGVQQKLQPYTNSENNRIEILAINAGVLTIFSGLLSSQDSDVKLVTLACMIFCVGLNLHFLNKLGLFPFKILPGFFKNLKAGK